MVQRIVEELTPWRKLAIICRKVGKEKIEAIDRQRRANPECAFPDLNSFMPDVADYEAALELEVRKELVEATLRWVRKYGPLSEALSLLKELDEINHQITKRDFPRIE
jgi:hypothetical protein